MTRNPFHLVEFSPWPLTASCGAFFLTVGLAGWMHGHNMLILNTGLICLILTMIMWWRDVVREATFQGAHTTPVETGLRWGMILFIASEVCFFFSFFWAYFHSSLAPTFELGSSWPPTGIYPLNPFQIPLLNTAVLLASGVTVTWAHHALMEGSRPSAIQSLTMTVILGVYFTALQASEYLEAPFAIADGIYGSTFFVATGFHGLHVLIGSAFLLVCLIRLHYFHYSKKHHFGFEAAAWYWHFVDVVWLFLYISIYWWGC
uniref:Cytochrome c oxidase subunit 3 n=1 Tax=Nucula nucleus TaxID=47129 RepID=D3G6E4_9BIVA|nr:cytochrome c oxidase subunit 3 [Nucula nucleus]